MPTPTLASQFKVGDEIYIIKYKGNDLVTDYSKTYFITKVEKEKKENNGSDEIITRMATLDNGTMHLLYSYSLYSFTQQGVTYYSEKKQPQYYYLCCPC